MEKTIPIKVKTYDNKIFVFDCYQSQNIGSLKEIIS